MLLPYIYIHAIYEYIHVCERKLSLLKVICLLCGCPYPYRLKLKAFHTLYVSPSSSEAPFTKIMRVCNGKLGWVGLLDCKVCAESTFTCLT